MINQNLQMNKFKDLLKSMSRRLDRIERYASAAAPEEIVDTTFSDYFINGATMGSSTISGYSLRMNKYVIVNARFGLGATYSNFAGTMYISVPFSYDPSMMADEKICGSFVAYDSSTATTYTGHMRPGGGGYYTPYPNGTPGTAMTATSPFTWAVNDWIAFLIQFPTLQGT